MKFVLLSADRDIYVAEVPDRIAKKLSNRCLDFCRWVHSPDGRRKYYNEKIGTVAYDPIIAFIDYLNTIESPEEKSVLVENLGNIEFDEIPEKYIKCKYFNF